MQTAPQRLGGFIPAASPPPYMIRPPGLSIWCRPQRPTHRNLAPWYRSAGRAGSAIDAHPFRRTFLRSRLRRDPLVRLAGTLAGNDPTSSASARSPEMERPRYLSKTTSSRFSSWLLGLTRGLLHQLAMLSVKNGPVTSQIRMRQLQNSARCHPDGRFDHPDGTRSHVRRCRDMRPCGSLCRGGASRKLQHLLPSSLFISPVSAFTSK